MSESLLTQQAAAVRLGVSLRTFQRMLAAADGPPAVQIGHRVMIHPDDLTMWLNERRAAAVRRAAHA